MSADGGPIPIGPLGKRGRHIRPRRSKPSADSEDSKITQSTGEATEKVQHIRKKPIVASTADSPAGPSSSRHNETGPSMKGKARLDSTRLTGRTDGDWRSPRAPAGEMKAKAFDSPQPSSRQSGRHQPNSARSNSVKGRDANDASSKPVRTLDLDRVFANMNPFRTNAVATESPGPKPEHRVRSDALTGYDLDYYLRQIEAAENPWPPNVKPFESAFKYTTTHPDPRTTFRSSEELREQITKLDETFKYMMWARRQKMQEEESSDDLPPRETALQRESLKILLSWVESAPTSQQQRDVLALVRRVNEVVQARFPRAKILVEPFGSVSWGGETSQLSDGQDWDLDLIMRDHDRPFGYTEEYWSSEPAPNSKLPPYYNVRIHAQALRQGGFQEVVPIVWANTPIVKFRDARTGCSMDLNLNDLGGYYNSQLILEYCKLSPYILRPFIHFVKSWSKARKLNDPSGQHGPPSLSSYCWVLICISYFHQASLLPNLQHSGLVTKAGRDSASIWVGFGKARGRQVEIYFADSDDVSDVGLAEPEKLAPENIFEELGRFFTWFQEYLTSPEENSEDDDIEEPRQWAGNTGISPYEGGLIERKRPYRKDALREIEQANIERKLLLRTANGKAETVVGAVLTTTTDELDGEQEDAEENAAPANVSADEQRKMDMAEPLMWQAQPLLVEDPLIHGKNCAGSLGAKTLKRLRSELDRAVRILSTDNPFIDDLLEPIEMPKRLTKKEKRELAAKNEAKNGESVGGGDAKKATGGGGRNGRSRRRDPRDPRAGAA